MVPLLSLSLAALLSLATALPQASNNFPPHRPAGPGDVRSPCPAMNSLANHGFIPRNGKRITLPIAVKGMADGLNIGPDFATALWTGGFASSSNPLSLSFDLSDLNLHNLAIEHDASLSRQDFFFGDLQPLNATIFDQFLAAAYPGQSIATIPATSKGKYSRVLDSRARNPQFLYGPREYIISYAEAGLFLSTMGNPTTGDAPLNFVNVFFREERLPYNEGWRKPSEPTTLSSIGNMILKLTTSSPEPVPEGIDAVTVGIIRNTVEGRDPITGVVRGITCPLLGCRGGNGGGR